MATESKEQYASQLLWQLVWLPGSCINDGLIIRFTAGELLAAFCRSALQARIAAESRSYSKNFCNDRVNPTVA